MKKSLKIFSIVLMALVMVFTAVNFSYADSAVEVIQGINANDDNIDIKGMQGIAGKVLGLLQVISAILAVILIAYLGLKMILGSANEKADVQKQFIPLILGTVIVFAATSIAKLLLGIMTNSNS